MVAPCWFHAIHRASSTICLSVYQTNLDNHGLTQIPMFFISPVADSSLAYSNILAEWLSSMKQNKVYIPDEPFPHASLVKNSRLKHFKHIYSEGFSAEFRQVSLHDLITVIGKVLHVYIDFSLVWCFVVIRVFASVTPYILSSCGDLIRCTRLSLQVWCFFENYFYI